MLASLDSLEARFADAVKAAYAQVEANPNISLAGLLQGAFYSVFGPDGLNLLKDSTDAGNDVTADDIVRSSGSANGNFVQWDALLGKTYTLTVPFELGVDLASLDTPGLEKVGLTLDAPNGILLKARWEFKLGFGLQQPPAGGGFYVKSDAIDPVRPGIPSVPELSIILSAEAAPARDGFGNPTASTASGLQGEIDLGVLHATAEDGTITRVAVSGDPFISVGSVVTSHDYTGAFTLALQDSVRGPHTYSINYSGHGAETFASFLLNLNTQINSALQSGGYSTAFPPVVLTADGSVVNGLFEPNTNSYLNGGGPGGPALIITSTLPDITGITVTGAEEYGFTSVQYEDSRAKGLGFARGQSSVAGADLVASLDAPGSGDLHDVNVNFQLTVGSTVVPVVLNGVLNRDSVSLTDLQARVAAALASSLSQAGLASNAVTVSLQGTKFVFSSASALQVNYKATDTTLMEIAFTVDFKDPNFFLANYDAANQLTYNRLSKSEYKAAKTAGQISTVMLPVLATKAKLRLHINSDAAGLSGYAEQGLGLAGGTLGLPTVALDLKLDASQVTDFTKTGSDRTKRKLDSLIFDNVVVDAGSLLNLVLKPVANVFGKTLGPVLSVIGSGASATDGFLNQPIKFLQDIGLGSYSILDLASKLSGGDISQLNAFFDGITAIATFGTDVSNFLATYDGKPISFGGFKYVKDSPTVLVPLELANMVQSIKLDDFNALPNAIFLKGGFKVDLLKPGSMIKLLLGNTFDIVSYSLPLVDFTLKSKLGFDFKALSFKVEVGARIQLWPAGFVYDSTGLERVANTTRAGGKADYADLLDGFYVKNNPAGKELEVTLFGTSSGGVDVELAKLDASTSLSGSLNFDLKDPNADGKLRLDEIYALTKGFQSANDVVAIFDAGVNLRFKFDISGGLGIGAARVSISASDLGFATNIDFTLNLTDALGAGVGAAANPTTPAPTLAKVVSQGGLNVVQINAGPLATNRTFGSVSDAAGASYTVTGNASSITVALGGAGSQTLTGNFDRVLIVGDSGNDTFNFAGLAGVAVEVHGGGGNDTITTGSGNAVVYGDGGNDTITTGTGNDSIFGGAGNDTINAGDGNNTVDGGAGNDTIIGGGGDDILDGGLDNDMVYSGGGNNVVLGNWGADNLYIGSGTVVFRTDPGGNTLDGGSGDDVFFINDSGSATGLTATLSSGRLSINPDTNFTNIEGITITLGGGDDVFTITGAAVAINIDGGVGAADLLVLDRSAATAALTGNISNLKLTGFDVADISYAAFEQVEVRSGSGADTVTIDSTGAGVTTTVKTADGADQITVNAISGPTVLNGQAGSDRVTLSVTGAPTGFNGIALTVETLLIDNSSYATAVAWSYKDGKVFVDGSPTPLVDALGAEIVEFRGGTSLTDSLSVEDSVANPQTVTVLDNSVEIVEGLNVLSQADGDPLSTLTYSLAINGLVGSAGRPLKLATSADGKFLYVGSYADNSVSAFRILSNGSLQFFQKVKNGTYGETGLTGVNEVAVGGDGKQVYVAADGGLVQLDRDTETGRLTYRALVSPTATQHITLQSNGSNVYTTTAATLNRFSRNTATGVLTFADSKGPGASAYSVLVVSPDSTDVYVATATQIERYNVGATGVLTGVTATTTALAGVKDLAVSATKLFVAHTGGASSFTRALAGRVNAASNGGAAAISVSINAAGAVIFGYDTTTAGSTTSGGHTQYTLDQIYISDSQDGTGDQHDEVYFKYRSSTGGSGNLGPGGSGSTPSLADKTFHNLNLGPFNVADGSGSTGVYDVIEGWDYDSASGDDKIGEFTITEGDSLGAHVVTIAGGGGSWDIYYNLALVGTVTTQLSANEYQVFSTGDLSVAAGKTLDVGSDTTRLAVNDLVYVGNFFYASQNTDSKVTVGNVSAGTITTTTKDNATTETGIPYQSGTNESNFDSGGGSIFYTLSHGNSAYLVSALDAGGLVNLGASVQPLDGITKDSQLVFDTAGIWAYLTRPGIHAITGFIRNPGTGALTAFQTVNGLTNPTFGLIDAAAVAMSADDLHIYVASQGGDISIFSRNTLNGTLTFVSTISTLGVSAPSSMTFVGDFLYITSPGNNRVVVASRSAADGSLALVQTVEQGVSGVEGIGGATILDFNSTNGRLFVGGKTNNTIASFSRSATTGMLTFVGSVRNGASGVSGLGGLVDLAVTSDDAYLVAAGSTDASLAVLKIDATTGQLTFVQRLRNGAAGVTGMVGPASVDSVAGKVYITSGSTGSVVTFSIATGLPTAGRYFARYSGMETLTVTTAGGPDLVTVRGLTLPFTLNTGAGDDSVVVYDTAPGKGTTINLGDGADRLELRSTGVGATTVVNGENDGDTIIIASTGSGTTTVNTGIGSNTVQVDASSTRLGATLTINGGGTDALILDTKGSTTVPNTPTDGATGGAGFAATGSISVTGAGFGINYSSIENLKRIAAPTANAGGPYTIQEGDAITLVASGSVIPDTTLNGVPVYEWDLNGDGFFGDVVGEIVTLPWLAFSAFGLNDNGVFQIALRVTNNQGFGVALAAATINEKQPVINLAANAAADQFLPYALNLSVTDPGNDTVTGFTVNWGDGSATSSTIGKTGIASHVYSTAGAYSVTVTTSDEDGGPYQATQALTVNVGAAPVRSLSGAGSVNEGASYTLNVAASGAGAGNVTEWLVNWGDGSSSTFTGAGGALNHTYADDGGFVITAQVKSSDGGVGAATNSKLLQVLNVAPAITFTNTSATVAEGGTFTISALAATDPGTDAVANWIIDWGDGTSTTLAAATTSASHAYRDNAAYTAKVAVVDEDGIHVCATSVAVTVSNVAPTLVLTGSATVNEGSTYVLQLSTTDLGQDRVSQWQINWGDGSATQTFAGQLVTVSHVYADGTVGRTITATATDEDGSFVNTKNITVNDVVPAPTVSSDATVINEGGAFVLKLAANDPGPDAITSWTINWGDGTPAQTVVGNPATVTHAFADNGSYTVLASVLQSGNTYNAAGLGVTVRNVAPKIALSGQPLVDSRTAFQLVLGTVTDPGTDTVTQYIVNWGDGTTNTYGTAGTVGHVYTDATGFHNISVALTDEDGTHQVAGLLKVANEGSPSGLDLSPLNDLTDKCVVDWGDGISITYPSSTNANFAQPVTHVYADEGIYTITIKVEDSLGARRTLGTRALVMNNVFPVGFNDAYSTDEDTALLLNPVANDTDVGSADVLRVAGIDGIMFFNVTGTTRLRTAPVSTALGANVLVLDNGQITYTPRSSAIFQMLVAGMQLVDTFQYTLIDQDGGFHTANAVVTVAGRGAVELDLNLNFTPVINGVPRLPGNDFTIDRIDIIRDATTITFKLDGITFFTHNIADITGSSIQVKNSNDPLEVNEQRVPASLLNLGVPLQLLPLDPSQTFGIGTGVAGDYTLNELLSGNVTGGYSSITFGQPNQNHLTDIGSASAPGTPVLFNTPLTIYGNGINQYADLLGSGTTSFTSIGTGTGYMLRGNQSVSGNLIINDALIVRGDRVLEAGGDILIKLPAGTINGDSDGTPDNLTIRAGGRVLIEGDIGGIAGNGLRNLTIESATEVVFGGVVQLTGALVIRPASGPALVPANFTAFQTASKIVFPRQVTVSQMDLAATALVDFGGDVTTTTGSIQLALDANTGVLLARSRITSATSLTVTNANAATFQGRVLLGGAMQLSVRSNVDFGDELTTTSGGMAFTMDGTTGQLLLRSRVTSAAGLTINSLRDATFQGRTVLAGALTQAEGTGSTNFVQAVVASSVDLKTSVLVNFRSSLDVGAGNIRIEADGIDFGGGSNSVAGTGLVTLMPRTPSATIDIGSPAFGTGTLDLSDTDIGALRDGFSRVVIGRASDGSGQVTIGSTLFRDSAEVYGGNVTVKDNSLAAQETLQLSARQDLLIQANVDVTGATVLQAGLGGVSGAITQTAGLLTTTLVTATGRTGVTLITSIVDLIAHNTGAGSINITETNTINLADVDTLNGSVSVAAAGKITATDVDVLGAGADVLLTTTGGADLDVVNITAQDTVSLLAAGAVLDANTAGADISAASLVITATTGIGSANPLDTAVSVLAASNSMSGNIQVLNTVGSLLTVGTVNSVVGLTNSGTGVGNIVITNGSPLTVASNVMNSAGGDITLTATSDGGSDDHLVISARVVASGGNGNIVLNAGTDLAINDSSSPIDISVAGAGIITATAQRNVEISANVTVQSVSGAVSFIADNAVGNNGSTLTMNDTALVDAGSATATLQADGSITLGGVKTTNSSSTAVTITSTSGALVDGGDSLTEIDAVNGTALLNAATGIGTLANSLEMNLKSLTATNTTSGGIYVQETSGLVITGTGVRTLGGNGNVVVDVVGGNLDVNAVVSAHGTGTVTLTAGAGTLTQAAGINISSTSGNLLLSAQVVAQNANLSTGGPGTITVTATSGGITMADGTLATTNGGSGLVTYTAATDVLLAQLTTGGNLAVTADSDSNGTGGITDNLTGETLANLTGSLATLSAGAGLGSADDLETNLATLDARNTGAGDVRINELAAGGGLVVNRLVQTGTAQAGQLVLTTESGTVTIAAGQAGVSTAGTGGISLTAAGLDADLLVNATISGVAGGVSLNAPRQIAINALVRQTGAGVIGLVAGNDVVQTANVTSQGGAINVTATAAAIVMQDGTTTSTTGAATVTYQAGTGVQLAALVSGTGTLIVTATAGAITEGTAAEVPNLTTSGLAVLAAGTGIGAAGAGDLDTAIGSVQATSSNGGIFLEEASGLALAGTGVRALAGTGTVSVMVTAGNLTVNAAVAATGGNVLLSALGTGAEIVLAQDVASGGGHISIRAGGALTQLANSDVTSAGGTLDLEAVTGTFMMAGSATLQSQGGNIRVAAGGSAVVGIVDARTAAGVTGGGISDQANWGQVAVTAGSFITPASSAAKLSASALRLSAGQDIGGEQAATYRLQATTNFTTWTDVTTVTSSAATVSLTDTPTGSFRFYRLIVTGTGLPVMVRPPVVQANGQVVLTIERAPTLSYLATEVATLAAGSANAGVVVQDDTDVTVDTVGTVAVNRVAAGGTSVEQSAAATSDVVAGAGGAVRVRSLAGTVTINDGVNADGAGVTAVSGDVLVQAAVNVGINAALNTASGNVSMLAGAAVNFSATGAAVTGGAGTVDVQATAGAVAMTNGARLVTGGGNLRVQAGTSVTLGVADARTAADRTGSTLTGQANWGSVAVIAGTGGITDAEAGDTGTNIFASGVRLEAAGNLGAFAALNPLELEVTTLAGASTGGGVSLLEATNVTVDTVGTVGVNRVAMTGAASVVQSAAAMSDLSSGGHLVLRTVGGSLTVNDGVSANSNGVAASGSGNVLLQAQGAGAGVTLNTAVTSGTGSVSVLAAGDVTLAAAASVVTGGAGTVDVQASSGNVTMAATAKLQTDGGNLRVVAGQNVVLGVVDARTPADRTGSALTSQAAWGQVSITAGTGAVTDASAAGDTAVNVYAQTVRLTTVTNVGTITPDNAIETEVLNVSALASAGNVNLRDASGLAVVVAGVVPANRVQADGTVLATQDAAGQSGVVRAAGGTTILQPGDDTQVANFPGLSVLTVLSNGPNSQTGLYEQTIRITNTTGSTIDAVRVRVRNLQSGVTLYNGVGTVNGQAYVLYNQPLLAGQSVDLVMEYFVPGGFITLPTPSNFVAEPVPTQPIVTPVGTVLSGVLTTRLNDGRYLVQFNSLAGLKYYVQYSLDQVTWKTALPQLMGDGLTFNWIDSGPPKTDTAPDFSASRYYRVLLVP